MQKRIIIDGVETQYLISSDGKVFSEKTNRYLKGTTKRNEYLSVQLQINKKPKSVMVHRLVAEAFLPKPENPNCNIVHHINEDKMDNRVENLAWVSNMENIQASIKPIQPKENGVKYLDFNNEEWKEIPGYENYVATKSGKIANKKTGRILEGTYRNGYLRVYIKNKFLTSHCLIYDTFIGNRNGVIDHINGIRDDNRLENLRCISQSENVQNAMKNGHKCQKKAYEYDLEGNFIQEYESVTKAAKEKGVTNCAIYAAAKRKGTSCGRYWVVEGYGITIKDILNKK